MSENRTARKTKAALVAENTRMRAALEKCSAAHLISDQNGIDWEGLAREFYRRMVVATEALNV